MTVLPVQNADVPLQDRSAGPAADLAPDLREDLLRYAELGGFTLALDTHPWYAAAGAVTGPEEARAASTILAEVRGGDLAGVREAAARLAAEAVLREPATVTEVAALVALLRRVRETATTLRTGAYEADLDALAAATANGSWRKERGLKLSWGRRRRLRAEARRLAVADRPRRDGLHAALVAAAAEREEWQALAPAPGTSARPVDGELLESTGQSAETLATGLRELGRLLADRDLTALEFDELTDLVDRLAADEGTLYRLLELRTLRMTLEAGGLGELLVELTAARADRAAAQAAYARSVAVADVADVADVEVAEVEEAEAEVEQIVIPAPASEPVPAPAPVAEAEAAVEAEPEPEAAVEPEPEAAVEPEVEPEAEPEAVAVVEEPVIEPEAEVEAEIEVEVAPEAVAAEPEPEVVTEVVTEVEAEVEVEAVAVEPEVEPEPVAADPEPVKRVRRPKKPELVAGRAITAYSAEELLALVRWIDSDFVVRTDDELLRATMKELGFARLGPRIKEALGAAVTAARPDSA